MCVFYAVLQDCDPAVEDFEGIKKERQLRWQNRKAAWSRLGTGTIDVERLLFDLVGCGERLGGVYADAPVRVETGMSSGVIKEVRARAG